MADPHPFHDIHTHGFVRVAAATPMASVGDVATNVAETLALARQGHEDGVDLIVYPELNVTSYAIDDLLLQAAQHRATETAIAEIARESETLAPVLLVGAALPRNGRLYNCAVVIKGGRVLGVVPKSFLPNYLEYYEKRHFALGHGLAGLDITIAGRTVPFGTDLVFAADDLDAFIFHVEICEDLWTASPPSSEGALAGALLLCNLSASPVTIGKSRDRAMLCAAQSMSCIAAYAYSAAGPGESTTDLAWDGQGLIYEAGEELAHSHRFGTAPELVVADVDLGRLALERMRNGSFNDSAAAADHPEMRFRRVTFTQDAQHVNDLRRPVPRFPFVPDEPTRLEEDCYEAFNIQVAGLAKRVEASKAKTLVLGISGGIDSTHALILAAKAFDRLGRDRSDILGFTMPGFATSEATKANAWALMRALGVTGDEIDIRPAAGQMLTDMDHPFADGEPVYDVTFENVQAGLRTDYLFRLANQRGGLVVGTGDLSEMALGWCTYGVGDQMSHYAVNAGVPKTLIQYLIRWCERTNQFDHETDTVLEAILDTEISPELVPADADGAIQSTEDRIGPYALHDHFLHHIARAGLAPSKAAFLAWHAWRDAGAGQWPEGYPEARKTAYDLDTVTRWLEIFLARFFGFSQFKRSAIPNGPKVSAAGALSPRGDWRAPSDGTADVWLKELESALPR